MKIKKVIISYLCVALLFSGCTSPDKYAKGSYITFGTYPQTAKGTDKTPIEWLVLDRDGESPSKLKWMES